MKRWTCIACALAFAATCSLATADVVVSNYEDVTEGFKGQSFAHNGVTYHDVNGVAGVFPGGETFDADPDDTQVIIETATYLYNDFPDFGSANNCMTFGGFFVPGDNLTLGPLSRVTMDLDQTADSASLDIAYYENGPWGGIVYTLDALSGGEIVATDSFTISDLGGRDNPAFSTLSVGGTQFDQLRLYAMYGTEYSLPRAMIDDLAIGYVPEPTAAVLLGLGSMFLLRRRR